MVEISMQSYSANKKVEDVNTVIDLEKAFTKLDQEQVEMQTLMEQFQLNQ